jgi:hypothetical protein
MVIRKGGEMNILLTRLLKLIEPQAAEVAVAVDAVAMTSVSGASGEYPTQRENRDSVIVCSFFPFNRTTIQ